MTFQESRNVFGPEALSRFTHILEEVMVELIGDGVPPTLVRSIETRTRLSQKLLGFARFWWTDTQIKQLLLRTFRNEISARKYASAWGMADSQTRAENVLEHTDSREVIRTAYLGVDKSEAVWRKAVRTSRAQD